MRQILAGATALCVGVVFASMAGASIVVDFDPVYNAYIQNVHACGPDCDANGKDDLAELNCFETTLASGSFPAIEAAYSANVAQAKQQLEDVLAVPSDNAIPCSAKEGIGIEDILEAIVARVPPPNWSRSTTRPCPP